MILEAGTLNHTVPVYFTDDDGGTAPGEPTTGLAFGDIETGGSASYQRQGAARVDFTLVTQTVAGGHTDGGFIQIDATNMPGNYRLDVPDAAFAVGVAYVVIMLVAASGNNSIMRPIVVDLSPPVNVVAQAGGVIPAPAVTGIPDVNVTHQGDGAIPAPAVTGVPDVNVTHQGDGAIPSPAVTGIPDVNPTHWADGAIPAQGITGVPEVDVTHQVAGLVPTPNTTGIPDTNVQEWKDEIVPAPAATGVPDVNVTHQGDGAIPAPAATGVPAVDLTHVEGATTIPEPAQGVPPATPGFAALWGWFWLQWRNDGKVTETERQVAGDDGVVRAKATMSDDGSEFSPGEMESGP